MEMQLLRWLFEDEHGEPQVLLAADRAMAYQLAPANWRLLDSQPTYEPIFDGVVVAEKPRPHFTFKWEPLEDELTGYRLTDGKLHPITHRTEVR
jgi:hypothetical protein